ncbi:hypothetical protein [Stenotrophomonas oahuensis]|uniref:Uncharacterized protein n=1 Tax=Stenotrophomonas oahuensis TaxID=3003271 RepID=A0ABY9YVA3_9GAMM|nr:hypothetical protein [Stenotrophomonas sp. A5586]WNH54797.1 hypothetical protein PDM29_20855 [Stenotrophomonas sp. A5586]
MGKQEAGDKQPSPATYSVIVAPAHLGAAVGRKVLVCGHGLFASLDKSAPKPTEGFIDQPSRRAGPVLTGFKKGETAARLFIAIDERLVHQPKVRYALALDYYLRWGMAHSKAPLVLLGGAESEGTTYIDVMVFSNGTLRDLFEHELPAHDHRDFVISLKVLLRKIADDCPGARIVAAAPLPDWRNDDVEYIGDAPLKALSFRPLGASKAGAPGVKASAAVAIAGLLAYGVQVGYGWKSYSDAGAGYKAEVADPVLSDAGGINNARLELLQRREFYMQEIRPQEALAKKSRQIVSGIATLPGVRINSITFGSSNAGTLNSAAAVDASGAPIAQPVEPNVTMELLVQQSADSALTDAESLMTAISARTGMRLRLQKAQGWSTDETTGIRKLRIEGFTQ